MFKITVQEIVKTSVGGMADVEKGDVLVERYTQTVDEIDQRRMDAIIAAVNKVPRKRRAAKGAQE